MNAAEDLQRAFQRAAQARAAIENIVEAVAAAEVDLPEAFARGDADPLVGRVFAVKVLQACPGVGKVRARRTLSSLGVPDGVCLRDLSADQRVKIVEAFAALGSADGI